MTDQATPTHQNQDQDADSSDAIEHASDALREKLLDAMTPGFEAECSPLEAELAGAFEENALSQKDARESAMDAHGPDEEAQGVPANVIVGTFPTRNMAGKRES